jgi:hypothetical protein
MKLQFCSFAERWSFFCFSPREGMPPMPDTLLTSTPQRTSHARSPGVTPVSFSLDKEALQYAREHAVGRGALGQYLSRLIYEERARQEERQRLAALLQKM